MSLTLKDYLKTLQKKRVAVVGIGVSNTPLVKLLLAAGISVTACDRKTQAQLGGLAEELTALGAALSLGEGYLDNLDQDVIFRAPGIRPDEKPFLDAIARGGVLTSEMEVFFQVCPCPIIAVTGSDGKTTTTTLIAEMLKGGGHTVHLGGNIGKPLLAEVEAMEAGDMAVLELSSFQLMTLRESPSICVMTNLSPNHLDIHTSMEEYRQAKKNIFLHQGPNDIAVFNLDNEETRRLAEQAKGQVRCFSRRETVERGAFVKDGMIYMAQGQEPKALFSVEEILIPGEHNVENYLAAMTALQGLVPVAVMQETAKRFPGVAHRIELVDTVDGVRYYNDSIASSPTRTIAGLRAFQERVILIAGGYDKKIPFEELGEEICRRVKTVVLNGYTAEKIKQAVLAAPSYQESKPELLMAENFEQAVLTARRIAKDGDIVLLSPACASFDQFPNFAARGDRFKAMVTHFFSLQAALKEFSSGLCCGPSGFEAEVASLAVRRMKEFMPEAYLDRFGNAVGYRPSGKPGAKKLLLDAHLDEIGLIVTGLEQGFLRVRPIGGVDPRILPNLKVTILTQPPLPGVIGTLPPHIQAVTEQGKSTPIEALWVDTGLNPKEAADRIPIGTPVAFASGFTQLENGLVAGKSLDDRAGFVALLQAAKLLKDEALDVDLYLMGSSREEVNGSGAAVGTFRLKPDCCIAVDVTHGRTPDGPKEETFPLGKGPVIGIGPNMTRWVTARLIAKAEALGQDWQPEVMPGHSGTNAWNMQISREGIPCGVLSIPLKYMHTPYEVLRLSDLEQVGALLAAFVKQAGAEGRWQ